MNTTPLVSIVTPSFNQVEFIEQTILSVLNQTYSNIEYIIIDGGSTDGSLEIIKKYSSSLKYWTSEKDNGQTDALLKGIKQVKGQIFAYLNSDDLLELNAVELIVNKYLKTPNFTLYYGQCLVIDENNKKIVPYQGGITSFKYLLTQKMMPFVHQPACFFNIKLINRSFLFNIKYSFCFDYELILWIFKYKNAKYIDLPLAQYRVHDKAKTSVSKQKMIAEKLSIQWQYGKQYWPLWLWREMKFRISTILALHHNK
jgi:glycosyltransferase involved in cell wall biosynthesis